MSNLLSFSRLVILVVFWQATLPLAFAQSYDCEEELFPKKDKATRLYGYVNALGEFRIPPTFLKAKPFAGRNAVVQQGNRFGVVNCEGILVVPADYEEIASFSNGKGWVKKGGLWGLVDVKGRVLIAPKYEDVKEINPFSGTSTWVKQQGLWGLLSKENGRMILNPQYDDVSTISDSAGICRKTAVQDLVYFGDGRVIISGMKKVRKINRNLFFYQANDNQWGAFNALAFIIVRPQWSSIQLNGSMIQVEKDGLNGLRNLKGGEVLPPRFQVLEPFVQGFAAVREGKSWQILDSRAGFNLPADQTFDFTRVIQGNVAIVSKNELFGIWNPMEKKWIQPVSFASVRSSSDKEWLELKKKDGKVQGFDCKSTKLSPENWDSLCTLDPARQIRGFVNQKTSITSAPYFKPGTFYSEVIPLSDGYLACRESGKTGVIRNTNQAVLPFEFEQIKCLKTSSGIAFKVQKEGKTGLLSEKGQELLPLKFEDVQPARGMLYLVKQNSKFGIMDSKGAWILENKYDSIVGSIRSADETDFPVAAYRKGKATLVDASGTPLFDPIEATLFYVGESSWAAKRKEGFSLWLGKGKEIGDVNFEQFQPFSEGNIPVQVKGKWGFMNHSGRLVIPAKFDEVLPYINGIAYARENGLWGVLKKNGSWLVKPSGLRVETDESGKRHLVLP